ncbi:hypothetical protein ACYE2N_03555 [Flavobacterium sp. MAHUQ-51]|uniref:hypothetical protein n=1 Tax=Flavobacterium sp. GCM10022190 TaxID=3252639 RepID=UPI00361D6337
MKKLIVLLIVAFTFLKCQTKSEEVNLASKSTDDINKIVEAIIQQDSLDVFKNRPNPRMFCSELNKITVDIPIKRKDGLVFPPIPGNIYINNLLNDKVNGEEFFTSKDSLSILEQNSNPEKIEIDKEISEKLNSTTLEIELAKKKNGKKYDFYNLSIPIFSQDRQKAFVELEHHCGSLCGSGTGFYLKKVNGKWKVVEKWRTWIS